MGRDDEPAHTYPTFRLAHDNRSGRKELSAKGARNAEKSGEKAWADAKAAMARVRAVCISGDHGNGTADTSGPPLGSSGQGRTRARNITDRRESPGSRRIAVTETHDGPEPGESRHGAQRRNDDDNGGQAKHPDRIHEPISISASGMEHKNITSPQSGILP
jgi:hypothetical protein